MDIWGYLFLHGYRTDRVVSVSHSHSIRVMCLVSQIEDITTSLTVRVKACSFFQTFRVFVRLVDVD